MFNRYHDDAGLTFDTVPFDSWSGRQCAVIVRSPDHAHDATRKDGLHLDSFSYYPVVFIQTRGLLALPQESVM